MYSCAPVCTEAQYLKKVIGTPYFHWAIVHGRLSTNTHKM